ncbi:MAG: DUF1553 domain-containing protein [Planctomycetaceae bacterium]
MLLPISARLLMSLTRIAAVNRFLTVLGAVGVVVLLLSGAQAAIAQTPDSGDDLYVSRIRPLLRQRCTACHGALRQESGLRLDTAAFIRSGGTSGPAIVSGDAAGSLLMMKVSASDSDHRMPPEDAGEPLTAEQQLLLQRWIAAGAPAPITDQPETDPRDHWAFRPILRPDVPAVSDVALADRLAVNSSTHPIDLLLAAQLRQQDLAPLPETSRELLLRRLSLDLIGLPPTAEELQAVRSDPRGDWYERTVDRLLADPRHGERWARHWMDIWRYSDWWGLGDQLRNSQKHIWNWRDWIVESLNSDQPYDEMLRLMLAADELHPEDLSRLRATGFLARNYFLFNRPQWMDETVEHVSKSFLGLTFNCARCHDHKYDPIDQADYYRLRAFFEPYHARLDVVPGESDLERNGIPRVFDAHPDDPTWLYIRGDEKRPDKSQPIAPGMPSVFSFAPITITPVTLPVEAWQPQRRTWVADAYMTAARRKLEVATASRDAARQTLETARNASGRQPLTAAAQTAEGVVADPFQSLDPTRWQLFAGSWKHSPGRLEQQQDGPRRAALRLLKQHPQDFDASVRFTIVGGSQYRSVGLSFDAAPGDPTADSGADYYEQNVYISGQSPGSKIHAAWNAGGRWNYPPAPAVRSLPIAPGIEYLLRVQVRGSLLNASLNGVPVLACQLATERRPGTLQITTFDAIVAIHEFQLAPLDSATALRSAGSLSADGVPAAPDAVTAQQDLDTAEAAVLLAVAEVSEVECRTAALRAIWQDATATVRQETHAAAIRAARLLAVASARHSLQVAQREHQRAPADRTAAAVAAVKAAEDAVVRAEAAVSGEVDPAAPLTEFIGARWTPTRFFSSGTDDPVPKFLPQSTGRRSALAAWITHRSNPLTARVAVNHVWMRHLGQPLVPTVFDFGLKAPEPLQSRLLDWLAAEFIESGWSLKQLHRSIVLSAAYRRSTSPPPGDSRIAADPENHWYWRRLPGRMESQLVRDSLLALAGTLDPTLGGPSVPSAQQADSRRRSLYFHHSNNDRNLFLTMFDEALVTDCYRREQSIVPQQALALSNSRLVLDSAPLIAARVTADSFRLVPHAATDDDRFISAAFLLLLGAEPTAGELAAARQAISEWQQLPEAASQPDLAPAEFARTQLIQVLLNHHDLITVR